MKSVRHMYEIVPPARRPWAEKVIPRVMAGTFIFMGLATAALLICMALSVGWMLWRG